MGSEQLIEDLFSLMKALLNPSDKLSWLSVLRAPWLGLNSADLLAIANQAKEENIWSTILQAENILSLSADARKRTATFVERLSIGMHLRYQVPLRDLVECSWESIHGAAVINSQRELACAHQFFNLLDQHETAGGIVDLNSFEESVYNSFIPNLSNAIDEMTSTAVQLLTMHKAKGLEFDHVIIPGLANQPRSDDKSLFIWHERLNKQAQARLFVAALTATGAEDDELYKLLRYEKQQQTLLESTRLLYIAVTRAKKSAKLFAAVPLNKNEELQIPAQSLLNRIWPEIQRSTKELRVNSLEDLQKDTQGPTTKDELSDANSISTPTPIRRFTTIESLDSAEKSMLENLIGEYSEEQDLSQEAQQQVPSIDENLAASRKEKDLYAKIGELIHESLEDYCNEKEDLVITDFLDSQSPYWQLQLRNFVESKTELEQSLDSIKDSISKSVEDPKLNWIFTSNNNDAKSEYSLSSIVKGKIQTHIVDRTLVDDQGTRWIIDFKTGIPDAEDENAFIADQVAQHQEQLNRYEDLFLQIENRKTKKALLFTAIPRLVEI